LHVYVFARGAAAFALRERRGGMQARDPDVGPSPSLDQISTEWSLIRDSGHFVKRYAAAMRNYLRALVKDPHDAEDVLQEFLLRVLTHGFLRARQDRGRFRDYLKVAVRNAALNYLQRKKYPRASRVPLPSAAVASPQPSADEEWVAGWREAVLRRAWRALERHQREHPGNLGFTVLRLVAAHPEEDSPALAARAGRSSGRRLRAEAFRKQVSRARRLFAQLLVNEVAQTLDHPTPGQVTDELSDLGLLAYVRDFLPPDLGLSGQTGGGS
jgi:hypothetical protein